MKKLTLSLICLICAVALSAAVRFVSFTPADGVALMADRGTGMARDIVFDSCHEHRGVAIALGNLAEDFNRVCGVTPEVVDMKQARRAKELRIVVGSLDRSDLVRKLVKEGKIDGSMLEGKWEKYIITTVGPDIVIAGSDKRGTIYGIYELSRQMGVNPWYWWADVPTPPQEQVYIKPGLYTDGEPAVKYRGIFINDEWPSFGTWAGKHFGGINSKMYSHMFELLLRLKANYLWPAMWASAFNEDDPLSPTVANDYGIVMGTSHHEPMMRAHKEYTSRRESVGPWDYSVNKERLDRFFEEGVERNKEYDNIITIGMRGDGDVAMGKGDDVDNMKTLRDVVDSQRDIIARVYGKPASEVPQLWAIFTEVQRYYDAGFTVPDDVTLLFCDNNWGYIRRTGPAREQGRKGGMGMYYHIDMNGGPWNDRWVNTTTPAKLREQLNLAYRTGIDRIWIINVGDLKPKEMPIDFIMNYAWNPDAYPADAMEDYMVDWARGCFGGEYAREIADIVTEYSRLNLERKAEVQTPGIYSAATGEAQRMMKRWEDIERRTMTLSARIPEEYRDAFYQLVEYPAVASAGVARIYLAATLGQPELMRELYERDSVMTERYNKGIAAGKWDGMMLDKHIGYTKWSMPDANVLPEPMPPTPDSLVAQADEVAVMAYDYARRTAAPSARWTYLPGLGRGKGCMGVEPVTAPSYPDGDGPALEYELEFKGDAPAKLALGILPTNDVNPARGLRVGVRVDDGETIIVDARQGYVDTFNEYTKDNIARSGVLKPLPPRASDIYLAGVGKRMRNEIFDNLRWLSIPLGQVAPGRHRLSVVMVDPEIVVEKLVLNPDNEHPSYYGSPAE